MAKRARMNNTSNLIPSPFSTDMQDDWNDLAQSDKERPSLLTQVILIVVVSVMVMVFFLGM